MKSLEMSGDGWVALADLLKVLAEPKRLLILNLLMEGVQCNCELGDARRCHPT
jgi:DNA-binding transcriptional ArsR family regulator